MKPPPLPRFARSSGHRRSGGFSLVETVLALGITAFCCVAMMGLLALSSKLDLNSKSQTAANGILSAVVSDLRSASLASRTAGGGETSLQYGIKLPSAPMLSSSGPVLLYFTGDGSCSSTFSPDARYLVTVTFLPNAASRGATLADLKVTWPASAAATRAFGSVESFLALDCN
ncbi:Verru_Chthon cassette protein B [Verrucomicrobium sp. GAS474]|uniref:hypothetical protein n=1 Tax=Verrucomicrobium sp. GAS474 TaxID=1882831 RepID=UPI00087C9AF6|nr:hypothetical protein [Verrucomicrobium sp. GAS474]SDT93990.1 Verru_Chthon cassette protein B [Verrucomicrobium sp. GAS474]